MRLGSFDDVVKSVADSLPSSFVLADDETGEVRLYVVLPAEFSYGQGALVLRAHLALLGQRWRMTAGERGRSVLEEVAVAPSEPLALPFGPGWRVPGSAQPLVDQLRDFLSWLGRRDVTDFNGAMNRVEVQLKLGRVWTPSKRNQILRWLKGDELHGLPGKGITLSASPAASAWHHALFELSPGAKTVATSGVPHGGMLMRWMMTWCESSRMSCRAPTSRS